MNFMLQNFPCETVNQLSNLVCLFILIQRLFTQKFHRRDLRKDLDNCAGVSKFETTMYLLVDQSVHFSILLTNFAFVTGQVTSSSLGEFVINSRSTRGGSFVISEFHILCNF